MFKSIFDNPKTTVAGLTSIVMGVITIVSGNIIEGIGLIATGLMGIFAKDATNRN